MADEYIERITSFLDAHQIEDFSFENLSKHRKARITYRGHVYGIVFPKTGSDWRGPANTVSTIRHALGLFEPKASRGEVSRRIRRRKTASHRARHVSRAPVSEPTRPQPDTFLSPLMILKARLEAANAAAVAAEADSNASAAKPIRIALRTPWLGTKTRYATV